MKEAYHKLRVFFPGKKFNLLILNVVGLFTVSLFEMLGVAAVLPIVNLAMGAPIEGYLKQVAELFGNPDRTSSLSSVWYSCWHSSLKERSRSLLNVGAWGLSQHSRVPLRLIC